MPAKNPSPGFVVFANGVPFDKTYATRAEAECAAAAYRPHGPHVSYNVVPDDGRTPWHAASGYPGGWWRVVRNTYRPGHGLHMEESKGSGGRRRLFRTQASARRAADALNAADINPDRRVAH